MRVTGQEFVQALDQRADEIYSACTACGDCFVVCPSAGPAGLISEDPRVVTAGVRQMLRDGRGPEAAETWAAKCTGSGTCIPVCNYGVNPRLMLTLARTAAKRVQAVGDAVKDAGRTGFLKMSRAVRVLSQLQLTAQDLARLGQAHRDSDTDETSPDLIFYTGCNVLKTPHIILLALDVLDRLGVRYTVMGGPSHCCGVIQFRVADARRGGGMGFSTIEKFEATGAGNVVAWCPSCQVQFGDVGLPTFERAAGRTPFDMTMFVIWLAERLDQLQPLMVHPVNRRVGLHEHPGVPGVTEAAITLLKAIPGLEYVELEQPRVGYMCNTLNPLMDHKRDLHAAVLQAAADAGVTTLAGVYHACHRELCSHERDWPFEVVNFMELIGESIGVSRPDLFKQLKMMQDADAIMADLADVIAARGLDPTEVRAVVEQDLLAEQPLPLRVL